MQERRKSEIWECRSDSRDGGFATRYTRFSLDLGCAWNEPLPLEVLSFPPAQKLGAPQTPQSGLSPLWNPMTRYAEGDLIHLNRTGGEASRPCTPLSR